MGIQRENHLQINNTNLAKLEMEVKERTLRESSGSSLIVLGNKFGRFPGRDMATGPHNIAIRPKHCPTETQSFERGDSHVCSVVEVPKSETRKTEAA
jgi:hypothetical protein